MLAAITRTLSSRGYVPPARLEQALRAKALHGGSLPLNLVLLGDLNEHVLAAAWGRRHRYRRASADELSGIELSTFELLPIEIIYDTGLLPLRRVGDARLLVGVVDPVEPERLDEAQFFAGMELEPCIVTATEMAGAFEMLAGQPWKRRLDELRRAQQGVADQLDDTVLAQAVDALCAVDTELEKAMFDVDLDRSVALQVGALPPDVDPSYSKRQPPATGDPERVHTRTELVAPSDVEPETIVELGDAHRKPAATPVIGSGSVAAAPVSSSRDEIIELEVPASHPDAPTRPMDALRRRGDDAIPTEPLEPVARITGTSARVSGRSGSLPAFRDAHGIERTADGRAATQSTLRLSGVNTAAPEVVDGPSALDVRMTPVAGVDSATVATDTFRAIRLPTVDGVDVTDFHGVFGDRLDIFDGTGTPNDVTRAAFHACGEAIDLTEDRDAIARDLTEVLSIVFPTVLVLSLRLPSLVLWSGHARRGPARLDGQRFDLQEGSVWHRVAAGAEAFRGRLSGHDPLRVVLGRELSDDTIAAPFLMKDRTVAIVVVDAGYLGALPGVEGLWETLERSVAAAFRRAIVQKKRSVRTV